ncbi:flavodoxin domain-containing protein [Anaeromicropila herbilytica]|uniref:Flavodoxin n=1 Tax=Anaeromicropila herbilytica TaxID=2785025 RepID=A0A7R7EKN1_9FIRM|nr:flavodoxin domain-containing protein [Anaeromicropila herbilytica]BCN30522.1 flavodoxin [Anaeromicropila herbilytica]
MNTLIVYASKHGTTKKCADLLAKQLVGNVELVNLNKAYSITTWNYDTVILGGSIYAGRIRKEISDFCTKNMKELKNVRVGLFICAMSEGEEAVKLIEQNFQEELRNRAIAKESFGGEFLMEQMNFLERFIIKKISKVTTNQSNIREDNIKKFADEVNS